MKEDKIINNSFNTGEMHHSDLSQPLKIDSRVSELYEDQMGENVVEARTKSILNDELYAIFQTSSYYKKYKNPKRVDKGDMMKMYYYFKGEVEKSENKFSTTDFFIGFAEFFEINYDQLYTDVGVMDKEMILKELNEKFNISNKIKIKRLF